MSETPWEESITTSAEFETALNKLLAAAETNDIDTRGSWVYHGTSTTSFKLEVVIYELEE